LGKSSKLGDIKAEGGLPIRGLAESPGHSIPAQHRRPDHPDCSPEFTFVVEYFRRGLRNRG
jgi:hypothetical protein